jgi:uncharacterized protein (TIGR02246 family)
MKQATGMLLVCDAWIVCVQTVFAADQAAERALIDKAIESYTAAFNAGDAEKLAAQWSPAAVYVNPLTGTQVEGREAIAKEFESVFSGLGSTQLAVEVQSIQFISPQVAVENGISRMIADDAPAHESTYTAVHIK